MKNSKSAAKILLGKNQIKCEKTNVIKYFKVSVPVYQCHIQLQFISIIRLVIRIKFSQHRGFCAGVKLNS
jgi:hypothetical protein